MRTVGLIVMCAALAACNSKSSEPAAAPADSATPAAEVAAPAAAVPAAAIKPAPEMLPSRIAREVITAGKHACADVAKAERNAQDGSIIASCTSGESYRVYTVDGQGPVAVKL